MTINEAIEIIANFDKHIIPCDEYGYRIDSDLMEAHSMAVNALSNTWIPVSERLPEIVKTTKAGRNTYRKSNRVLCACLQKNGKKIVKEGYMEFFNDYPEPSWIIPGTIHSVTHWMPLPDLPKEDA